MDEVKPQAEPVQNSGLLQPLDQSAAVSPSSVVPPVQPHPMHRVFVGPHGLRAGWRLLLYAAFWRFFVFLLDTLPLPRGMHGIWLDLAAESKRMVAVLLPALVMAAIEKRTPYQGYFSLVGSLVVIPIICAIEAGILFVIFNVVIVLTHWPAVVDGRDLRLRPSRTI